MTIDIKLPGWGGICKGPQGKFDTPPFILCCLKDINYVHHTLKTKLYYFFCTDYLCKFFGILLYRFDFCPLIN